jgi:hypothetical protein
MLPVESFELPLWTALKQAAIAPHDVEMRHLLQVLDEALDTLDTTAQLQVAAEAIAQINQVFHDHSQVLFEDLQAFANAEGLVMPEDAFDRYVRQSMKVDFDPYIQPLPPLPRALHHRQVQSIAEENQSVVGEVDKAVLLQVLAQQQQPVSEAEAYAEAYAEVWAIAHDEDVSAWIGAVQADLNQRCEPTVSLLELQQSLEMLLVKVWLELLLGEYHIQSKGEFYEVASIFIQRFPSA